MPATLIQSNAGGFGSINGADSLTTSSVGFGSTTAAGNTLICVIYASNELVEGGGGCYTPSINPPMTVGYSTSWSLGGEAYFPEPPSSGAQFQSGAVAIYYISNAPSMSGALLTSVTIPAPGNGLGNDSTTYAEFDLYEIHGVGPLAASASGVAGAGGSPRTPNLLVSETCAVFDAMLAEYVWATSGVGTNGPAAAGYTLGINASHQFDARGYNAIGQTQYNLSASSGNINTAFTATNVPYWACVAIAFEVIVSTSVYPSGVTAVSAVGTPFPGYQGVHATMAVGIAHILATSNVHPLGVSAIASPGITWAGQGINYGNVVAGSSGLPSAVNPTNFYVRWQGYITPTISGLYTIGVNSEDGCNLFIGNQLLINNINSIQSANSTQAYTQFFNLELTVGTYYPIILEWQHGSGYDFECQLLWTVPGQTNPSLIPVGNMSSENNVTTGIMIGMWWNLTTSSQFSNQLKLINAQLKARLTTNDSSTTPIFTGASLDNQ
jgi:hypothetical protein